MSINGVKFYSHTMQGVTEFMFTKFCDCRTDRTEPICLLGEGETYQSRNHGSMTRYRQKNEEGLNGFYGYTTEPFPFSTL